MNKRALQAMTYSEFVENVRITFGKIGNEDITIDYVSDNLISYHTGLRELVGPFYAIAQTFHHGFKDVL
jgi:hypothetical protein